MKASSENVVFILSLYEYIENIDTPIIRRYNSLSDVPQEPTATFADRYAAEARLHRYHESTYISSNPIVINSWTQDITQSSMLMSDSSEKSISKCGCWFLRNIT